MTQLSDRISALLADQLLQIQSPAENVVEAHITDGPASETLAENLRDVFPDLQITVRYQPGDRHDSVRVTFREDSPSNPTDALTSPADENHPPQPTDLPHALPPHVSMYSLSQRLGSDKNGNSIWAVTILELTNGVLCNKTEDVADILQQPLAENDTIVSHWDGEHLIRFFRQHLEQIGVPGKHQTFVAEIGAQAARHPARRMNKAPRVSD